MTTLSELTSFPEGAYDELTARIRAHEGLVLKVYDDATGHLVIPGSVLVGHPTIGYGRALDVKGVSFSEAEAMLHSDLVRLVQDVRLRFPWTIDLDPRRFGVLVEMAYQMGVRGLAEFALFLGHLQRGDWLRAGAAMMESRWATRQSPIRAAALRTVIETGEAL